MMESRVPDIENAASDHKSLIRIGGTAAFVVVALILGVLILFTVYPQPATVADWFDLFQSNRLIGLLDFWGLEVLMYLMFALVFLAFYGVLREADPGRMTIAVTFCLLGVGIFLATNNPFSMLSLSDQYAAATTEPQRAALLAAGQAVLTHTGQRIAGGFNMGLFLVSIAGLIVSAVMLHSSAFSRSTAIIGIAAHAFSLLDYLRQAVTQSAVVALLVIVPNALLLVVWYVLAGRRLHQLGRG